MAHGSRRWGDGHIVIVEDDDEARAECSGIIHGFIGHACAHRAVANHGDDIESVARHITGDGHAKPRRNAGRGVACAERVILRLVALAKTR